MKFFQASRIFLNSNKEYYGVFMKGKKREGKN
jgi:hypothetical protein